MTINLEKDIGMMLDDIRFRRVIYRGPCSPCGGLKFNYLEYLEKKGFPIDLIAAAYENCEQHAVIPITLKVFEGERGYAARMKDFGNGFGVFETVENFRSGKKYSKNGGKGLKLFDESGHEVSYDGDIFFYGNIINMCWKKD